MLLYYDILRRVLCLSAMRVVFSINYLISRHFLLCYGNELNMCTQIQLIPHKIIMSIILKGSIYINIRRLDIGIYRHSFDTDDQSSHSN